MDRKYKLAIVGASGLVGRTVLKVLEEKNLPNLEYVLFASEKSANTAIHFFNDTYIIKKLNENSFDEGFNFAIFCAGGEVSKKYAPIAVSKGCIVIDNSSTFRMDKDVPLVVPEINPEDIKWNKGIIANPNCSTIQAVVPLNILNKKYKIKRIVYSTYQAVSGAGRNGIEDLQNGIAGKNELKKFPYPIFNNCLPHIDVFLENGYTKEEMKMINETRKILHCENLPITATAVRVPVLNCHSESINVEFENDFDLDELKKCLSDSENIILQDDPSNQIYPLATIADNHDEVFVGRIRRDFSVKYGINMWVVADNIRKGAATNAVQILEKILKEKN